ncbi:MAG: acetyl-CoA C-acyltransferase [Cyclobacteriaceae bacterium]
MSKFNPVYVIAASRTPIGSFGGVLSALSAVELGTSAIKGAMNKASVASDTIDEVFMGNVISANLGQAPTRQAALHAGIHHHTPCTTINKVCASGMKAIMLGAQSIMLGQNHTVIAGGMESMSNIPFYIPKARFGYKFGNGELIDGLMKDGLLEPYHNFAMGNCAENTAKEMQISRQEQDDYAISSYERAAKAIQSGMFTDEIIPVEIQKRNATDIISEDEEYKKVTIEKIPSLRPVFDDKGTVTAANASTLNDGAAALVLVSEAQLKKLNMKPIARIAGFADAAREPLWFTTAPALAIPKALSMAGYSQGEVDYYEINEAFAVVSIANNRLLNLDPAIVNVFGGAVALGHPLGASGARIVTTLLSVLHHNKGKIGVAGICNGGGGASALVVEYLDN